MRLRCLPRRPALLIMMVLSTLLAACSNATIIASTATATPPATVSATTTGNAGGSNATPSSGGGGSTNPTATPLDTSVCKGLIPQGIVLSSADPNSIPFPANTIAADLSTLGGGDGQFRVQVKYICTSGMALQNVFTFFNGQMANRGWLHSNFFPYDAEAESAASPYTWALGTTYVTLENYLNRAGNSATYNMQIAYAPTAPTCTTVPNAGTPFGSGYVYFLFAQPAYPGVTDGFDHIALPPLTKLAFNGAAGNYYESLCSAGSAAMVKAFMDKHLRAVGWVPQGGGYYLYANKFGLYLEDGDSQQIKAGLHWYNPAAIGPLAGNQADVEGQAIWKFTVSRMWPRFISGWRQFC